MLTEIKTAADMQKLPASLLHALKGTSNPTGHRYTANIAKADRKLAIQAAVVRAITEGQISKDLGVEILVSNNAYGPKGKAAIKSIA